MVSASNALVNHSYSNSSWHHYLVECRWPIGCNCPGFFKSVWQGAAQTTRFLFCTFDSLCMKLEHYGIRGPALHWLENFLSDRTQQVVLDGCCSDILPVTSGVPQGTILAPLLFLCYINDLPELVSCCCRLYADDVLLYKVIRSDEDYASLQSDLNVLQKWADDWQMRFNALKCQHISFCSKQVQINFNYTYDL